MKTLLFRTRWREPLNCWFVNLHWGDKSGLSRFSRHEGFEKSMYNMKKLIVLVMMAVLAVGAMQARDRIYYDASPLPEMARQTIKKNFKAGVNHVKVDKDMFDTDYDVVLKDGTEIDFDKGGNWTSVETVNGVPSAFIIPEIQTYLKKNYKGQRVVKVSVDRRDYEVALSSGIELKFDRAGRFMYIDD